MKKSLYSDMALQCVSYQGLGLDLLSFTLGGADLGMLASAACSMMSYRAPAASLGEELGEPQKVVSSHCGPPVRNSWK